MNPKTFPASVAFVALGITACIKAPGPGSAGRIEAAGMRKIGTVDERFQSYNVEMVEVIGGRFWKPYRDIDALLKAQFSVTQSNKDAAAAPAVCSSTRGCASSQRP